MEDPMEQELLAIFTKTMNAHFPIQTGIAKDDYLNRFKAILAKEITDAPKLDTDKDNLAAYYHLSPIKKWIQRMLFFSRLNRKQILKRQEISEQHENGINGFKIKYVEGANPNEFGVDYLKCGICVYFARKNLFEYVKYCCLVDYAIMKNMGISFSRTTTLGNGGKKCDFRFAKEGRIKDGWPPPTCKNSIGTGKRL
jgi:hypothetical protein